MRRIDTRRAAGALVLLVGALNVVSVLTPGLFRRLEFLTDVLPGGVVSASAAVSVSVGVLLIGLALSLGRGKRRAWRITVALLVVELVLQLTQAHHLIAVASGVLLGLLLTQRRSFIGRSEPVGRSRAFAVGALLLVVSTVLGWVAVTVLDRYLGTGLSAGQRLTATVLGFVGIESPVTAGDTPRSDSVYDLLVALAATSMLVTGALVLRAPRHVEAKSEADDRDLRRLIISHGDSDSLAYFALRDDRALLWGPGRRSGISYRMVNGTMLASGDPLGPRDSWPDAISAFLAHARENSAVPAVVACTEAGAHAWTRYAGMSALEFGDEAVLDTATYTLQGRPMRNARQAVTRAQRAGYTVSCRRLSDCAAEDISNLADLADNWRGADIERGFSMALGRLDVIRDPDAVLVTAEVGGNVEALLFLVPWGGSDRLSLDLMRRDSQAVSGVNELMISGLMEQANALGVTRVSLNFAVFREAIERSQRIGAGPVTRLWGSVLRGVSRITQVDTLYRFNAKFCPEWQSRYLLYPKAGGLARVTWAYLRAESFLPSPFRPPVASAPLRTGGALDAISSVSTGRDGDSGEHVSGRPSGISR